MKVDGQCHCGSIAYEAEVEPDTIAICHCRDCQRQSGSAFRANVPAPAATFRLTKGEPKRYIKIAPSGARRVHAFCGECGGPVYSAAETNPTSYSLRTGALNQVDELGRPARQIWTQRRRPWTLCLDEVPAVDGQP